MTWVWCIATSNRRTILVADNDFAYLIDFGIAHASGDHTLTKAGETIGTAVYMAPEAIGAAVKTHSRVDVYALTCVLYECLTGQPPFISDVGVQGLIAHHLHTPPPQPSVTNSEVPVAFDAVIAKGMAKNPDDRYGSVHDLASAARAAAGDPTLTIMEVDPPPSRSRIKLSRRAIGLLVAGVAAVAVVLAGVVIFGRPSSDGSDASALPAPPVGQGYASQIALPFPEIRVAGGVAVDTAGTAYLTGIGTDRVMELEVGASAATQLPISGLKNPRDVAVDAKGGVYVTDSSNDRVVWLPAGAPAAATLPFTGLNDPRGIIVSPAGDVYVVDRGNDRVLFLAAGATTAVTLPFTGLNDPRGIAIDATGGVVVTDTGNNRVMQLSAGSTVAQALPFTGVNDPHGVAVDSKGTVYVTDRGNGEIVELRRGAMAAMPLPFTGLNDPQGVAVDGAGNVYVSDVGPNPVVKLVVG
ncbi:protein kinase [Mycolicibacterium sp. GCM10028919]|uniref:protein kinase domain-containing protein n=1 Tax=Mycolicibacterium sp. GCM10028919 TaxID=3273401 RepID=UPI00360755C7